jgi:hypothetical protein
MASAQCVACKGHEGGSLGSRPEAGLVTTGGPRFRGNVVPGHRQTGRAPSRRRPGRSGRGPHRQAQGADALSASCPLRPLRSLRSRSPVGAVGGIRFPGGRLPTETGMGSTVISRVKMCVTIAPRSAIPNTPPISQRRTGARRYIVAVATGCGSTLRAPLGPWCTAPRERRASARSPLCLRTAPRLSTRSSRSRT